ncbi:MAG: alpha/beta hydrolase [Oceanicaulis sp.]|nr:alpha/beta hydrolase [Oceanicaulis sp.]
MAHLNAILAAGAALAIAALTAAPAPANAPCISQDVAIPAGGDTVLAGTLTCPDTPVRAVMVMVTGSGPHTRDGVISGAPMFAELAEALAAGGIATLRVDEAGVGESTGPRTEGFFERVPHVAASLAHVRARPEFASVPAGVYGHSEGASLGVQAVADDTNAADFLVLVGAPGADGRTIWVDQQYALLSGQFAHLGEARLDAVRAALGAITDASIAGAREDVFAAVRTLFETLEAPASVYEDGSFDQYAERMAGREMQVFLSHDPVPAFSQVERPVLAVWGELDRQTRPGLNRPGLEAARHEAAEFTAVILEDQDHFFLRGEGLAPGEHRFGAMALAPELPAAILAWLETVLE